MKFKSIEIDIEIHKLIESKREEFVETPNEILRRVFEIKFPENRDVSKYSGGNGKPWRKGGVELPHGTQLKMNYNGIIYVAEISDGVWLLENGRQESSPSGAAHAVAVTKTGSRPSLNGKTLWMVKMPETNTWELYKDLEDRLTKN